MTPPRSSNPASGRVIASIAVLSALAVTPAYAYAESPVSDAAATTTTTAEPSPSAATPPATAATTTADESTAPAPAPAQTPGEPEPEPEVSPESTAAEPALTPPVGPSALPPQTSPTTTPSTTPADATSRRRSTRKAGADPVPGPDTQASDPNLIEPNPLELTPLANFSIQNFDIPPFLLPIYQAAGSEYGIAWQILAGINKIETDYGRNLGVSSAGALGWMQFMPATWAQYGVDANGDGVKDPMNPADAIFAAARYLRAAGGDQNATRAIFAYNHASWYVDDVMQNARGVASVPDSVISSLTGLTEGVFPLDAAEADVEFGAASAGLPASGGSKRAARRASATGAVPATTPTAPPADAANPARANPSSAQRTATTAKSVEITAPPATSVVAVQDGVVESVGDSPSLGAYVRIRDAYGNRYTYSELGHVQDDVAVPRPVLDGADTTADDESRAATPTTPSGTPAGVDTTTPASDPSPTTPATDARPTTPPSDPDPTTPATDARRPAGTAASGEKPTTPTERPALSTPTPASAPVASAAPETTPATPPKHATPTATPSAAGSVALSSTTTPRPVVSDAERERASTSLEPHVVLRVGEQITKRTSAGRKRRTVAVGEVLAAARGIGVDEARRLQAGPSAIPATPDAVSLSPGAAVTDPMSSYFSIDYGLTREQVSLRKLKAGQAVIAGTVLGKTKLALDGSTTSTVTFQVRPAGGGAPLVDPRPFLSGWQLSNRTDLYGAQAKQGVGKSDAATVGQIMLMSKAELSRRVLADRRISIYACGRQDIETAQIDRRVLALLEVLAEKNLAPVVTALKCGHGLMTSSGNVSEHSTGDAVDIGSVYGTVISPATQGPGSATDRAVRQILQLQGVMRPHQIISLMQYAGQDNTLALADHYDHIHVGYRPEGNAAAGVPASPATGALAPEQWNDLVTHLSTITAPRVATAPSAYAIAAAARRKR